MQCALSVFSLELYGSAVFIVFKSLVSKKWPRLWPSQPKFDNKTIFFLCWYQKLLISNRIPTGSCVNPLFHIWRWPSRGSSDQELHSKSFIAEQLILSGENLLTLCFNRHERKTIHRSNLEMSIWLVNWRLSAMKMSCFGSNTVWFCHVLLLDESEHPVEIRVSEQTFWVDP